MTYRLLLPKLAAAFLAIGTPSAMAQETIGTLPRVLVHAELAVHADGRTVDFVGVRNESSASGVVLVLGIPQGASLGANATWEALEQGEILDAAVVVAGDAKPYGKSFSGLEGIRSIHILTLLEGAADWESEMAVDLLASQSAALPPGSLASGIQANLVPGIPPTTTTMPDLIVQNLFTLPHPQTSVCTGNPIPDVSCYAIRNIRVYATVRNLGNAAVPANTTHVGWNVAQNTTNCLPAALQNQAIASAIPAFGTVIVNRNYYAGPCDILCFSSYSKTTCFNARVDPLGTVAETSEANNGHAGAPVLVCDYCLGGGPIGGPNQQGTVSAY